MQKVSSLSAVYVRALFSWNQLTALSEGCLYMNNIHLHNFNEYLCKLTVRKKKKKWDSTFCRQKNANYRKMTFGALVASKPVGPVSDVTKQDTSCESQ
jgi:hypothetical protein